MGRNGLVETFDPARLRARQTCKDNIPAMVELDRPIGDYAEECTALEIAAVGWSFGGKVLLKPIARPMFRDTKPVVSAAGVE
jgi:dienelactone hydrolase